MAGIVRRRWRRVAVLLVATLLAGAWASPGSAEAAGCTVTWVGPASGGSWATASSWSTGAVPVGADSVCLPAGVSVSVSSGATAGDVQGVGATLSVSSSLQLGDPAAVSHVSVLSQSGTVTTPGELRVSGVLTLSGSARLAGAGAVVVESGAAATINGATLDGITLRNEGSVTQSGTSQLFGKNGAVVDNSGTYVINTAHCLGCAFSPGVIWTPNGDAEPRFLNTGVIHKAAGGTGSVVSFGLDNDGAVTVDTGDITFTRGASGATSTGSWSGTSANGTILDGAFTLGSSIPVAGAFTVGSSGVVSVGDLDGGKLSVRGTLELADATGVSGVSSLDLSGTVRGPGEVRVADGLTLSSSSAKLLGSGSALVESTAIGTVAGGTLDGYTFRNEGSLTQTGTSQLLGKNGAVLDNRGTYTLNTAHCSGCSFSPGIQWIPNADAQPKLLNTGTLRKTAGGSGSVVSFGLDNDGVVSIDAGDVSFTRGATDEVSTGSWSGTATGRATLDGAFTLGSGVPITGPLTVGSAGVVSAGYLAGPDGALTVNGSLELRDSGVASRIGSLTHTGVIKGSGELRIAQSVAWTGGRLSGIGLVTVEAGATGTMGDATIDGFTFRNEGSITQSGTSQVVGKNGGVLDNRGTYTLNTGRCSGCSFAPGLVWTPSGDAQPKLLNTGTLRKTSGGSGTVVGFGLDNDGVVSIDAGDVSFTRGATESVSTGSWSGTSSGRPQLDGPFTLGAGVEVAGALAVGSQGAVTADDIQGPTGAMTVQGSLELTSGESTLSGLTQTGTTKVADELQIGQAMTMSGSGTLAGAGTVTLGSGGIGTIANGTLDRVTLRNYGSIGQTGTSQLFGKNGAVLDNRGTYVLNTAHCSGCLFAPGILWSPNGDEQPEFLNTGVLQKTAGGGGTTVSFGVDNDGSVSIDAGDVSFTRGASGSVSTGSWSGTSTGRPTLDGPFKFGSAAVTGAMAVGRGGTLSADLITGDAKLDVSGTLDLADAAGNSTAGALNLAGAVTGAGRLRVATSLTMNAGSTLRGSGYLYLPAEASGQINDGTIDGFTLRNDGSMVQGGSSQLWGKNGAVIENHGTYTNNAERCSGCLFDTGLLDQKSGATPVFVNLGVLQKTQGTGTGIVEWGLDNRGTIKELSGQLDLRGPIVRTAPEPDESYGPGNPATPNVQRSCSGKPVDCATGNQFESQLDLNVDGRGLGLQLVRTYNSQAAAAQTGPGTTGFGWTTSYSDRLVVEPDQRRATVEQSDGSTVPFLINADGTFGAPAWVQATLTKESDGTYTYMLPDLRRMTFDANGRLLTLADANGNATTPHYDGAGRLQSVTDPAGRALTFGYDDDGMLASATDPTGLTVHYAYESGALVSVTYEGADDPQWRFGYDSAHQLTSMIDGRGGTTTTSYDDEHRAISQTDALDRTRTWSYSDGETRITNPAGDVTVQRFDANGQPVSTTTADGTAAETTISMAYDANRNLVRVTDGNGKTTTFTHDAKGNTTSVTDPDGRVTSWTFDAQRNVTSETRPSGRVTTFAYDGHGNLTRESRTLARPGDADVTQATSYDYDGQGQLHTVTDPLGHTWTYDYDDAGDLVAATSPSGATTTWAYDAASRVTSTVSPRGNAPGADPDGYTTTITRDKYGRPTDVRDPLGHHTTTEYDADHNPTVVTDAAGDRTTVTYDAENQQTKVERAGQILGTDYDDDGRVVRQTRPNGKATTYDRDGAGRVTGITDPLGRETRVSYDGAGRVTASTDALSRTATYEYSAAGLLKTIDYASGTPDVSFEYDADGRRMRMTDGTGTSTYEYDTLDRLTATTNGHGKTVQYGYDLADQQTRLTYPNDQDVTRSYDVDGRVASVSDWLGHTTDIDYDADSNQTALRFPSATGRVDRADYDAADALSAITMAGSGDSSASITIARNGLGQVVSADATGLPGGDVTYEYDNFGRVTTAGQDSYAYDAVGNPTTLGSTTGLTYDDADQLVQATTPVGPVNYEYDAVGSRVATTPASGPATNYEYDQAGDLTAVRRAGDPAVSYAYDGDGLRASRTRSDSTTQLTWDATGGLPLLLSEGDTSYIYDPEGLPLERVDGDGHVVFFHHDQLGSTRMLTDGDGTVVATFAYDAFGQATDATGSVTTPLGYAGEYTDPDTGLVYLRTRDYDPATGQFLTRDPLEDVSGEPYLYAGGDPINDIDPSGLLSLGDIGMGISNGAAGILDGISGGVSTQLAGKAFGFDANCADFGTTFDVTRIVAEYTPWGRIGKGVRGIRALGAAAKGAEKTLGPRFAPGKWLQHFEKHGAEFGFRNSVDYLKGARDLVGRNGVATFTRANGDRLFYDAATNEFAVLRSDGVLRTYFRPRNGAAYWRAQTGL